jgi:nucleoside permease NupC
VTNIGANLIAIISFVSFINAVLQWFGTLVGADYLSFEFVLGKIFIPISWLMGVESNVSGEQRSSEFEKKIAKFGERSYVRKWEQRK